MTRTVFLPLAREPEVLLGLRLQDLFWVMAAAILNIFEWHAIKGSLELRLGLMGLTSALGLSFAVVRFSEASLPEWLVRYGRYRLSPRFYLP